MKGGERMRKEGRWRERGAKSKNFSKGNIGGVRVKEVTKKVFGNSAGESCGLTMAVRAWSFAASGRSGRSCWEALLGSYEQVMNRW